ncbi:hypothetical protein HOK021_61150 [Streptomyces hygroscopicus]|nr:hypothetical protein HOK021_61150 [Streptomyces hygroscopicus]
MHQQVIEPVHDIDLPQHVPDLISGPLGHLPGSGLIPPHTVLPGEPPQAEGEGPYHRDQPDRQAAPAKG